MALKKTKSKRKTHKIQRIIKKKMKSNQKRSKKMAKNGRKKGLKKDPGIPNLYPFKKQLLEKILKGKQKSQEEKIFKRFNSLKNDEKDKDLNEQKESPFGKDLKENKYPAKNKKYGAMLQKVIEMSDVILFVLDARDPEGCRNTDLERLILSKNSDALNSTKRLILVINKIDLVPADVSRQWLIYLKRELPIIVFKASTQGQKRRLGQSKTSQTNITDEELSHTNLSVGVETLISLLKKYSNSINGNFKSTPITVGVIGYPNVGKSSIINSLKRKKIASTSPIPGHTKDVQEIVLDKRLKLIDCPGVIFSGDNNYSTLVLKNSIRVEKIKNPEEFVSHILTKCPMRNLCEIYQIPPYKTCEQFLYLVANRKGILQKGGVVNNDLTSRSIIRDWNKGKISFYTEPPVIPERDHLNDTVRIVNKQSDVFDIEALLKQSEDDVNVCEMRNDSKFDNSSTFVPVDDVVNDNVMVDE